MVIKDLFHLPDIYFDCIEYFPMINHMGYIVTENETFIECVVYILNAMRDYKLKENKNA